MVILEDPDPIPGDQEEIKRSDITDPRFHHREAYIIRSVNWLKEFGVMPRAGGLDDQDLAWVEDVELYWSMKAQVQREYLAHKKEYDVTHPKDGSHPAGD